MVQNKAPCENGIQADHVKSNKRLANLKPDSSHNQDGKSRGTDKMKKMIKSRSIKLPDLEAHQTLSPRRSLSQPRKPPPLHVPTFSAFPQKYKPFERSSPNYMKPTICSDAKKELLPVSLPNSQSGSEGKNLPQKCLSDSKASSVSRNKPAKTLSRSSSLNLVRTLTKTPSFKPCKACPKKFTTAVLCADVNAPERPTCSSTLKDSKFPAYLMLNPGGTESEGASVMKVCSYRYCSLNGHHHAPLPQLNCFMSARRHLLNTQKSVKLEAPRKLKVSCETKKDSDIEQVVFDGKPAWDEADRGNPIIPPLAQEIDMEFFIEIYAKEEEDADEMGRFDSVENHEDQEDSIFAIEEDGNSANEDGVKQITVGVPCDLPKYEIDLEEDFKNNFDAAAIEEDWKRSCHQVQNVEDADDNHPPSRFHEEICTGSYCSEVSHDGEQMENTELDDSDSKDSNMEWEGQFCAEDHEEDSDSSVTMQEETDSEFDSSSESLHDVSEMWLDGILSNHIVDILGEEAPQASKEERSTCFKEQPHETDPILEDTSESIEFQTQETDCPSNGTGYEYDESSSTEEVFQHLMNSENNKKESERHVDDGAGCATMALDEETIENSEGHKISEACKTGESRENNNISLKNKDEGNNQENQIHSSDVPKESTIIVQDQELVEEDQVRASKFQTTSCKGGEEQNTRKNWQYAARHKRSVQDVEEMRKINPRKPNFLPLTPDPEPEKIDLKHQTMDERKNAEEWMLDFALRQAVTKLAPARKRKVSLLVEAFESVMSIPKCETRMRNDSPFGHARPIQACS